MALHRVFKDLLICVQSLYPVNILSILLRRNNYSYQSQKGPSWPTQTTAALPGPPACRELPDTCRLTNIEQPVTTSQYLESSAPLYHGSAHMQQASHDIVRGCRKHFSVQQLNDCESQVSLMGSGPSRLFYR